MFHGALATIGMATSARLAAALPQQWRKADFKHNLGNCKNALLVGMYRSTEAPIIEAGGGGVMVRLGGREVCWEVPDGSQWGVAPS